jgi:hypothetical protein
MDLTQEKGSAPFLKISGDVHFTILQELQVNKVNEGR